jgi:hypothetical protein
MFSQQSPTNANQKLLEDLETKVRAYPDKRGSTIGKRLFLRKSQAIE